MSNIILSMIFASIGIYNFLKMKKAKSNKDLYAMVDAICTSILAYLAMMLTILMR